jgi:hypothetical protein
MLQPKQGAHASHNEAVTDEQEEAEEEAQSYLQDEETEEEYADEATEATSQEVSADDEWTATSDEPSEQAAEAIVPDAQVVATEFRSPTADKAPQALKASRNQKRFKMDVMVDAPGAHHLRVERHRAGSDAARRLLKIRAGTWPNTGSSGYPSEASPRNADARVGPDRDFNDVRGGATFENDVTAVTFRIPHDGDPTTDSQIITLHGRATDPDTWVDTQVHPNDPYTPHFHDPYSGTAGTDTLDGPRAGAQNEPTDADATADPSTGTGTTPGTNPRGAHDPLKLDWQCSASADSQKAPAVAPFDTVGHAQGYRKSTGQRTQGNDPFFGDERTSCTTVPDVTGFKPACLVHSYDQPPAIKWGVHALQDGPAITITLHGPIQNWPLDNGAASVDHTCVLTATDPYGASDSMTVTITVEKEENDTPTSTWKSGGVTTYTVPHDHSPETHHVQVLLDGEHDDADNHRDNIGPLGNTATETTAMGTAKQLNWQFIDSSKTTDGFDGIFYGNAPAKKYMGTGYCADGTYGSRIYVDARTSLPAADLNRCQDACSDWPECHTLYWEESSSQCTMYSNCQNDDPTKITAGAGLRYTKEVYLGNCKLL